jgi:hypothetical protein
MTRTVLASGALLALVACGHGTGLSARPAQVGAGTKVRARMDAEIHSRHNTAGETVTATVSDAVKDAKGQVVIPEGATITFRIAALHESENKGDPGLLRLEPEQLNADGKSYPLVASVISVQRQLVGRKTNGNDVAKVGVGVGAGALVGGLVAGTKGAVIGGVAGGAVGTQRAIETKDRDVYVAKGSTVVISLKQKIIAQG